CQLRQLPVEAARSGGLLHRARLRSVRVRRRVKGIRMRDDDAFDLVVVRFEFFTSYWPLLSVCVYEPVVVFTDEDVGVNDRAAAEAAGDECLEVAEVPDVEHSVEPVVGVPEVLSEFLRAARKRPWRVAAAPFEQADAESGFRQPIGADGTAEAGTDNDSFEVHVGGSCLKPTACVPVAGRPGTLPRGLGSTTGRCRAYSGQGRPMPTGREASAARRL